jgi:hypothetical protein
MKKGTIEGVIETAWISNVAGFKNVAGLADIYYSKQCNIAKTDWYVYLYNKSSWILITFGKHTCLSRLCLKCSMLVS